MKLWVLVLTIYNTERRRHKKEGGEMGFSPSCKMMESVIVVMDANRSKGNLNALEWALNRVVRPKDNVILIGIICEFGKKTSCFPFYTGIGISAIWERLEFSGQVEMRPKEVQEEIAKKREQYQCALQPFYHLCKKIKVKLEVKLAAGFDPKKIAVEEARNSNTRWIVLDSHLRKHKAFIHEHTGCNIAAMKEKDVATIAMSVATDCEILTRKETDTEEFMLSTPQQEGMQSEDIIDRSSPPPSPCWYPLSWRTGFPRNFFQAEIESITNGFADENIVSEQENLKLYRGCFMETPVLVKCFSGSDERFWLEFQILSQVRHRNISNLVGYCCTDGSMFLLQDYSCDGSLDMHLQGDELAKNLTWQARLNIAKGTGSGLRYLHENCIDGPAMHIHVKSSDIFIYHGCPIILTELAPRKFQREHKASGEVLLRGNSVEFQGGADGASPLNVHAYGLLILELLTGRRASGNDESGEDPSLEDWALPLLETGLLNEIVDPRLMDSSDAKEVKYMASAALLCLRRDSKNPPSIGEVFAAIQGDCFRT